MPKANRTAFLVDPRIKAAYEKSLGPDGNALKQKRNSYTRIRNAIDGYLDWRDDRVIVNEERKRIEWVFENADLVGQNDLLRCHLAKADAYRKHWEKRVSDLVWQTKSEIRQWESLISYPLRYEAIYWTSHSQSMDEDNLISSTKMVLDSIVRNTSIPDDKSEFVRFPSVISQRDKKSRLMIALYPLSEWPVSEDTLAWLLPSSLVK